MRLLPLALASFVLAACAANGEMKINASSDEGASASAHAQEEAEGKTEGTKTLAANGTGESPPPAQPVTQAADAPRACPLQCFVAQRGRVSPAEEQRLAADLSEPLSSLRACGPGNSLTIRFDSGGKLTEFGVDAERGNEGSCVQAVRGRQPNISYPGPSTLRCYEKCPGDPTTTRSRGLRRR